MKYLTLVFVILIFGCKNEEAKQKNLAIISYEIFEEPQDLILGSIEYDDGVRYITYEMSFYFDNQIVYYREYGKWGCFELLQQGQGNYKIEGKKVIIELHHYTQTMIVAGKNISNAPEFTPTITLDHGHEGKTSNPIINKKTFEEKVQTLLNISGNITQKMMKARCELANQLK